LYFGCFYNACLFISSLSFTVCTFIHLFVSFYHFISSSWSRLNYLLVVFKMIGNQKINSFFGFNVVRHVCDSFKVSIESNSFVLKRWIFQHRMSAPAGNRIVGKEIVLFMISPPLQQHQIVKHNIFVLFHEFICYFTRSYLERIKKYIFLTKMYQLVLKCLSVLLD
jgi:hypothetical protein